MFGECLKMSLQTRITNTSQRTCTNAVAHTHLKTNAHTPHTPDHTRHAFKLARHRPRVCNLLQVFRFKIFLPSVSVIPTLLSQSGHGNDFSLALAYSSRDEENGKDCRSWFDHNSSKRGKAKDKDQEVLLLEERCRALRVSSSKRQAGVHLGRDDRPSGFHYRNGCGCVGRDCDNWHLPHSKHFEKEQMQDGKGFSIFRSQIEDRPRSPTRRSRGNTSSEERSVIAITDIASKRFENLVRLKSRKSFKDPRFKVIHCVTKIRDANISAAINYEHDKLHLGNSTETSVRKSKR